MLKAIHVLILIISMVLLAHSTPLSFFPSFFELHVQHMEVPRLGVELELQLLAYITGTAT